MALLFPHRELSTFPGQVQIEDPEQRRRATRELNKGEAENALKRAIFFHRIGRVRDRGPEQQGHRASGLNLVAAAIVLWNTTYLQLALDALAQHPRRSCCPTSRRSVGSTSS